MQFFQTHFNPKEDEKLLLISDSKSSLWNLHFEHFPNHSPYAISERIDFLKKYGPLTQYVESISKSVALKGRRFFYEREAQFAGRGKYALLDEWAFYEPIDQQRAIWPKHIDVELVRSKLRKRESPFLLNLRAQELRNRFYHLSTTDIPQLKERFELGKN
jgi:hypothetical protein